MCAGFNKSGLWLFNKEDSGLSSSAGEGEPSQQLRGGALFSSSLCLLINNKLKLENWLIIPQDG